MAHKAALPSELIDHTIDHLWDDQAALRACSLTCRDWVPSSRFHLFRTVRMRTSYDWKNLHVLLQSSPIIGYCIQKLTVSADSTGSDPAPQSLAREAWLDEVVEVLGKLQRVRTLALSRLRWDALSSETKQAFQGVFHTVKTLLLFDVRFNQSADVVHFLSSFPELNELYFHDVFWEHESRNPFAALEQEQQGQMHLSYLFLDPRSSPTLVTEWLLNHPVEQKLRTIQLCWREMEDAKALGDLLQVSGSALERLLVEFPAGLSEEVLRRNQLSISHNTNLRTLHFSGLDVSAASSRTFVSDQLFPWVAVMLGQIRSPQFHEVVFDMELPDVPDLHSFDWARIDRELSKEEFRGLAVRFYVNCTSRERDASLVEEARRAIGDRLPTFKARGHLFVSCL